MKIRRDRGSDTAEDFSFFDRFGHKEQTGLGGRSRVTAPSPTRQQLSPIPYSQPYSISPAIGVSPQYFSPGPGGPQLPPQVSKEEALLLMGLQPPGNLTNGTFRTSAVLKPMPSVAKRRVVDFRDTDEGDDGNFFGELDRLRHSNVSQFGDTNVYGTPLRVVAAREAELRKRPSWDVDPFTTDQVQSSPSYHGGLIEIPRSIVPQEDYSAMAKYRSYAQDAPAAGKYGNQPITGSSSSYSTPPRALRGPQRMEPLATQEADEIQRQLQGLKRDPILVVRGAFASAGAASPLALRKELSPQRLPPLSTSPPPMHHNKDVLNVPGGMYSHQIPSVVQGVLYGPSAVVREGGVKMLSSPQAKREAKSKRETAARRGKS